MDFLFVRSIDKHLHLTFCFQSSYYFFSIHFFRVILTKLLFKSSNELCETSQLERGIMYFQGFVRISKQFLDVYILHYFQKMPCRFLNISAILWRVVFYLEIGFKNLFHYGQPITQFIYVSLICRTTNNAMFVFFKVYVGQSITQIIFYSVLDSENCLNSFKRWICQLNTCFLFCDGVCSTPRNTLLIFFFNLICLGILNKILI